MHELRRETINGSNMQVRVEKYAESRLVASSGGGRIAGLIQDDGQLWISTEPASRHKRMHMARRTWDQQGSPALDSRDVEVFLENGWALR